MEKAAQSILIKVRDQILSRGAKTIRQLGRTFRALDSFDGNNKVDRNEFLVGLKENGVQITKEEANLLLEYIDTNKDGTVSFDEFLVAMRGQLNSKRQALVDKAFLKFDKDGNGVITTADLKGVFNASLHPKVQKGEMTEEQVFLEFMSNFADRNKDGKISREECNEYYSALSASIDNDEHFVLLMQTAWKLN